MRFEKNEIRILTEETEASEMPGTKVETDEMTDSYQRYAELVEDQMPVDVSLHFVPLKASVLAQMIYRRIGMEDCYCLLVNDDVINEEGMTDWIPDHIKCDLCLRDTDFDSTSTILLYLCRLYENGVVDPKEDTLLLQTILNSGTWLADMTWRAIHGQLEEAVYVRQQRENGDASE